MSDQFVLDVVQAAEIKYAAERNGVTNADLKTLSSGDMFARILPILRGTGQVVVATATKAVEKAKVYLRCLYETETIMIGATDGTETFASSGLFTGGVYGETLPKGDPIPTSETEATVHMQIGDGNFSQVSGETREWTQAQVCGFVRAHPDKLRKGGYATFFRVKGGFVASVLFDDNGRLFVHVHRFSLGLTWGADFRHRFVFPQL